MPPSDQAADAGAPAETTDPAAPAEAPPAEVAPAEAAPVETPPVEEPPAEPVAPPEATPERVEAEKANDAVQDGQTVVMDTSGLAHVTGTPTPDVVDGGGITVEKAVVLSTPIGTVTVAYEVDAEGTARVMATVVGTPAYAVVTEDIELLRLRSS